jgi:hypothetical protein
MCGRSLQPGHISALSVAKGGLRSRELEWKRELALRISSR